MTEPDSGTVAPKTYEYNPPYNLAATALEAACRDALAAASLGLRVLIEPVTWQAFRGGGNVNKATITAYRLSFPSEERDA